MRIGVYQNLLYENGGIRMVVCEYVYENRWVW